jgi:hypothetical protein
MSPAARHPAITIARNGNTIRSSLCILSFDEL